VKTESSPTGRGTEFEPAGDFDVTADWECPCDFCQGWRAANALQTDGSNCLDLASSDGDLEQVIAAWGELPVVMRRAIMALIRTDRNG